MKFSVRYQLIVQKDCDRLLAEQTGVKAVVIASADGFDLASASSGQLAPQKIAAMSSSISAIGDVVSQEADIGNATSITVKTEEGFMYISSLQVDGTDCILAVVCDEAAVLARVMLDCAEIRKRHKSLPRLVY